jgi:hypothetical protein
MSSEDIPSRRHRQTRGAIPNTTPPSQHPHNSQTLDPQAHSRDIASDNMNYSAQPTTPPRTPRRNNQPQNVPNSSVRENGSKQKSRNKRNKPQNVTASPAVKVRDRVTPPPAGTQSGGLSSAAKPINTPSVAMFAGATFHASPAPSALPIPSFYSKSVPESPGLKEPRSFKETSLSEAESPTPPVTRFSNDNVHREESPLDFFFRADREEKERARSASSLNPALKSTGPFPPPDNHRNAQTPPALGSQRRPSHLHRTSTSGSGMFAMELDGPQSPGAPLGPAFSTPYAERINAAKNNRPLEDAQNALERSEALKAYLFSDHPVSPPANTSTTTLEPSPMAPTSIYSPNNQRTPALASHSQQNNFSYAQDRRGTQYANASARTSGLRQEVTPKKTPSLTPNRNTHFAASPIHHQIYGNVMNSNPSNFMSNSTAHAASPSPSLSYGVSSGNKTTDIQGMENTLRKILKLESSQP